jgi:glycosyltransferase involved in cell wall biosynthesis
MVSQHPYPTHPTLRRNIAELIAQGVPVDLVCAATEAASAVPAVPGLRVHAIRAKHRRASLFQYPLEYLLFFVCAFVLVSFLALRHRYRVVQVDTLPDFLVFVAWVPRWRGARVVLYMYELMPEMAAARLRVGRRHALVRLAYWLEGAATAWADGVITVSDRFSRVLEGRGVEPGKLCVVTNAHPLVTATGRSPLQAPALVTQATLIERYGVHVAIEALGRLRAEWPSLRLYIFGKGESQPRLERLVQELGLAGQVCFRGFLPWREAMAEIQGATIGIVPIISDGYGDLVLPNKLFELVALGIPTACSCLPGITEHFPPDSLAYFSPGHAQGLAAQVDWLLHHPEDARQQAARARQAMIGLSWESVAPRYLRAVGAVP